MGDNAERLNNDPTLLAGLHGEGGDPAAGADVVLPSGQPLSCLVCGGQRFTRREIKMNTTGMTFMDLDWANRSGDGAVCRSSYPTREPPTPCRP